MSLLDHPLISQRYFFPRPQAPADPWWVDVNGERLACWKPKQPGFDRWLLHFHGNGEVVDDYIPGFPEMFATMGLSCAFAEYRGYGASTGRPLLSTMLDDAVQVFDALNVPPEKVVLFGRSVGSIYALHVAAQRPTIAGLILESGIADPLERLILRLNPREIGASFEALQDAVKQRLDHQHKMAHYPGPVLILHAQRDHLVEVNHAHHLADWAGGRATLQIFPHGDHNSIFAANHTAYIKAVAQFVAEVLP